MLENVKEKQCTLCKKVKPIDDFVSAFTLGYTNRCARCREQGQRAHRKYVDKNRDAINAYTSAYVRRRRGDTAAEGFQICYRCLGEFPIEQFPIGTNGQRRKMCVQCRAYYAVATTHSRRRHPETVAANRIRVLQRRRDSRRKCLEHYGLVCSCCGEAHYEFLAIDHIDGRGNIHRREIPSNRICPWLIKQGFPPGFRTLCWNCNWGCRLNNGVCPHEIERAAA